MSLEGTPSIALPAEFRAQLIVGAAEQVIPADLDPSEQRLALNSAISLLHKRNEELVVSKVVNDALCELPLTAERPGLD